MAIETVNTLVSLNAKERSVLVQVLGVSLSVDQGITWADDERDCIRSLIKKIGVVNDESS